MTTPQAPLIDRKRAAEMCANAADWILGLSAELGRPAPRFERDLRQLAAALEAAPTPGPRTAEEHERAAVKALRYAHALDGSGMSDRADDARKDAIVSIVEAAALRAMEMTTQAVDEARAELSTKPEKPKPYRVAEAPGRRRKGGRR